jgi:hypothetical protein
MTKGNTICPLAISWRGHKKNIHGIYGKMFTVLFDWLHLPANHIAPPDGIALPPDAAGLGCLPLCTCDVWMKQAEKGSYNPLY